MSVMCCVYVPEGIVMAADSRLRRTKNDKVEEIPATDEKTAYKVQTKIQYTSSDNAQKVLLINKTKTGISFCGNAIINGITVADYIRQFEIAEVYEYDTTEAVATKLAEYAKSSEAQFFVAGYDEDEPYVFDIHNGVSTRHNIQKNETKFGNADGDKGGVPLLLRLALVGQDNKLL